MIFDGVNGIDFIRTIEFWIGLMKPVIPQGQVEEYGCWKIIRLADGTYIYEYKSVQLN